VTADTLAQRGARGVMVACPPARQDAAVEQADREAFDALVETRSTGLLRTAYLLTGDWGTAEDLLQTALAKTWFHWSSLRDHGAAEAYVRRVMSRTSATWWRRKWHGERPTEVLPEVLSGGDPFGDADQREVLRRALASLPPRQRAVVVLRFYDDLSEAQVAELLGCSVGTVKSTTSRALARLRAGTALREAGTSRAAPLPGDHGKEQGA
jgi:RNA polymerase sigma-70 factor (sigma-E family)